MTAALLAVAALAALGIMAGAVEHQDQEDE